MIRYKHGDKNLANSLSAGFLQLGQNPVNLKGVYGCSFFDTFSPQIRFLRLFVEQTLTQQKHGTERP